MSLAPKIDELRESITLRNIDLICITETWLQNHIHDNIVLSLVITSNAATDLMANTVVCVSIYKEFSKLRSRI
jgi:hypothetical protein